MRLIRHVRGARSLLRIYTLGLNRSVGCLLRRGEVMVPLVLVRTSLEQDPDGQVKSDANEQSGDREMIDDSSNAAGGDDCGQWGQ